MNGFSHNKHLNVKRLNFKSNTNLESKNHPLPVFFEEALFPIAEEFPSMAEQFLSMADGAKPCCLSSN